MSIFKNIKRTLTHLVCMIMLILIQFDVCGYDLMRACQLADNPTPDYVCDSQTSVDDDDENVSTWSDPVYRGVNPRSLFKAPLMEFFSFIFQSLQGELPSYQYDSQFFQAKLLNLTYLRYCVLLI